MPPQPQNRSTIAIGSGPASYSGLIVFRRNAQSSLTPSTVSSPCDVSAVRTMCRLDLRHCGATGSYRQPTSETHNSLENSVLDETPEVLRDLGWDIASPNHDAK